MPGIVEHYFKRRRYTWPPHSRLTFANDIDNPLPSEHLRMHKKSDPDAPPMRYKGPRRHYLNRGLSVQAHLDNPKPTHRYYRRASTPAAAPSDEPGHSQETTQGPAV